MAIAPLPFIGLKIFVNEKRIVHKILILALIASNIIIANKTGSAKVIIGFVVGLVIFMLILILKTVSKKEIRFFLVFILLLSLLIGSFLFTDVIIESFQEIFISNDIGGARESIYTSSILIIQESPIVGFGPGQHAEISFDQFLDAHQSFLTIALQGGLIALLFYIFLHFKIVKSCLNDPFILGSYTGIFIYALGGDIIRRLPMWIFLILFYYYCMSEERPKFIKQNFYNRGLNT
jgi:O-antigen ligase